MANRPVLCVENLFSAGTGNQFPNHTLAAEEEATDHPVERIVNGRRSARDYHTSTTANNLTYIRLTCDQPRFANFVALDRGHNYAGVAIRLRKSGTGFTTMQDVLNLTIPASRAVASIDDAEGVLTEEGAWLKRWTGDAAKYWEWEVAAMGASTTPLTVGLMLSTALEPRIFDEPWSDEPGVLIGSQVQSPAGWLGRGTTNTVRQGSIGLRADTDLEYAQFRYHLLSLYGRGWPMWLVFDPAMGHKAMQVVNPLGPIPEFAHTGDRWPNLRAGTIPWVEHEAKRR